jgi:hypothetical protein
VRFECRKSAIERQVPVMRTLEGRRTTKSGDDPIQVPALPPEVSSLFRVSANPWVQRVDQHIRLLNSLVSKLPRQYKWQFRTVEAFQAEYEELAQTANDALPINQLLWKDHIGSCQAYSLMSTWRVVDLARGCVWAVAGNEVVAAALLARSGIETAAQFADMARRTAATLIGATPEDSKGRLLDPEVDLRKNVIASDDFEELVLKTLFATRLPGTEETYQAKNVLGIIQNASKVVGQELLLGMYELLCEVAHPNFLGKSIYLLDQHANGRRGRELRVIGPGAGPTAREIIETTLGALSWACGTNVSAFDLMSKTLQPVFRRLQSS